MKPVSLTIAGLQSYREEQRIDFSALCEAGVFGIFGPTGSGKSTILDAITLAMYGIVERGGNSIQGIMNGAEDTLSVAFEFELSDGAQRKRYKAERTYRRKPDGSVEQRLSRLTEKGFDGGETIVLADKSGDVTAHVEKLIGLSMTDFTRAVVLPQGKFSEFLGLKGRERREMLQRLFRLERYGDELAGRLAGRRSRVESRMREAAAELQGLGDASPEAVASAEQALADAVVLEGASLERQTALEMKHAELSRLWEWQEEARTLAAERTSLHARESEMAQLEALLADAAAADRLLPLWTERRECRERAERLGAELLRLESLQDEAGVREAAAREAHRAAERTLSEGEAPALVRLEQLRQAMELAEQARAGERAAAGWAAAKEKALTERNGCAEALEKKTALRAKGAAKQSELKRELAACDVTGEERKLLAAAQGARNAWMLTAKAATSAKAEAEAYARAAADREAAVRRLEEETTSAAARLLPLRQSLAVLSIGLKDTESVLAALEDTLPLHISAAASALIGDERKKWALALAEGLQPGESCPVCGSAHHPGRTVPETDGTESEQHALHDKLEALEKLLGDVRHLSARVRKESVSAESGLDRLSSASQFRPEVSAAEWSQSAAEAAVSLNEDKGSSEMSELFAERQSFVQTAAAQIPAIVADIGGALQYWEDCRGRLRDAVAAHAAAHGVSEAAAAKAKAASSEAIEAQAAWEREFPGLSPETLEERVRDLERRDEAARELRERLEKSEQFLADIASELDALQRELAEKEKALAHAEAQEAAEARSLAQIKDALGRVVGDGGDASIQTHELQKKLDGWREAERAARVAAEEARLALEEAGRSLAAGTEALKGAKERLQSAENRWIEALQQSPFESEEDLLSRRLSAERRKSMEEETARYRESITSIAARLEAVLRRLNGKSVEEAEWKESAEALQTAKAERETALANRAKAERWAEQLREKHEQWTKLTKEHEQLSSLHGQLSKLHTVFRGNAFVEFLAEEQLYGVTRAASDRLAQLTRGRYAIEVDSGGGFVIRDDTNGGIRRPVSTLSGGETFLTSLSLALALSAQIQLGGKYPLEFFFLDEGFGTLDPELLDNVVTALERLHIERFSVGVISHVPELQARLPRKLVVTPAEPFGAGSRVRMESM